MDKSDKWIIIILAIWILINTALWVAGLIRHKTAQYFSVVNALTALILIVYWIQHEIRITQHLIEMREVAVLSFEALVIAISVYAISSVTIPHSIKIIQYIIFALHFTFLILFLIFMLTFKMGRLI